MTLFSKPVRSLLAVSAVLASTASMAIAEDKSPQALVDAIKQGGLVVFIRHAETERDYADQVTADPLQCNTQRVLGEFGWKQAKAIGQAVKDAAIPVDSVTSSQYCRAWQTADLAFGTYEMNPDFNFEPAEEYSDEQFAAMRDRVRPHLAKTPPAGTNAVIVGHDDPFEAATGIYPEPQGVTFVIRPDGNGDFEILGSIAPDAWPGM